MTVKERVLCGLGFHGELGEPIQRIFFSDKNGADRGLYGFQQICSVCGRLVTVKV